MTILGRFFSSLFTALLFLIMELDNENNWQTIYNGFHAAINEKTPIGEITIPGVFIGHTIRAYCNSLKAKSTWWLGGNLKHLLGNSQPDFVGSEWKVPLKQKTLIILPPFTAEYKIKFVPAKWLREIALVIEMYTG